MPPTLAQQLAQALAQRQSMQAQRDSYRNTVYRNLIEAGNKPLESYWSGSARQEVAMRRQRLLELAGRINSNSLPTEQEIESLRPSSERSVQGQAMSMWAYFSPSALPGSPSFNQVISWRNAAKSKYSDFLSTASDLDRLNSQIQDLQTKYQQEQANSGGNDSGDGDQPPPPPPPPPPPTPEPPVPTTPETVAPAQDRNRSRRDIARVAFGNPRYGVGLNIPLGT